eukprot:UC1_evm1s2173
MSEQNEKVAAAAIATTASAVDVPAPVASGSALADPAGKADAIAEAMTAIDKMEALRKGLSSKMYKIRKGKMYLRKFSIPSDKTAIQWESSKKRGTKSKILMSLIKKLVEGQDTDVFKTAVSKDPTLADKAKQSFSIVYTVLPDEEGGAITEDTLDLVCETSSDCRKWIRHLRTIITSTQACLDAMKLGALMTKCRPKKQYLRRYILTNDHKLRWEPSKKDGRVDLRHVKFIRTGQSTKAFRRAKNVRQHEQLSFSLVYRLSEDAGGDATEEQDDGFETLDLIAESADDFLVWVTGLRALVMGARDSQVLLQKGTRLTKVRRNGSSVTREYTLSEDMSQILWSSRGRSRHLALKDIKELRRGQNTEEWRLAADNHDNAVCFSIIHGNRYHVLNFAAETREDYEDWMVALDDLLFTIFEQPRVVHVLSDSHILSSFHAFTRILQAQSNARNAEVKASLNATQAAELLFTTDPALKTGQTKRKLTAIITQSGGEVDAAGFAQLYREVSNRPELGSLFRMTAQDLFGPHRNSRLNAGAGEDPAVEMVVTPSQLRDFLIREQHMGTEETFSIADAAAIIAQHEPRQAGSTEDPKTMTRMGFSSMM